MTKETLAQEALRLLIPIPKEEFITDTYTDGKGKCCAIGHMQRLQSMDPSDYSSYNCSDFLAEQPIRSASRKYLSDIHNIHGHNIASVNNGDLTINGYTEPEIKDRVIHLLTDMVAAGY